MFTGNRATLGYKFSGSKCFKVSSSLHHLMHLQGIVVSLHDFRRVLAAPRVPAPPGSLSQIELFLSRAKTTESFLLPMPSNDGAPSHGPHTRKTSTMGKTEAEGTYLVLRFIQGRSGARIAERDSSEGSDIVGE